MDITLVLITYIITAIPSSNVDKNKLDLVLMAMS